MRTRRRTTHAAATCCALALSWLVPLAAQSAVALEETLRTLGGCRITTTDVMFLPYDPVNVNAKKPLDGAGGFDITCTLGTIAMIGIDSGAHAAVSGRRMAESRTFLGYELYKDANRTDVWGANGPDAVTLPAASSATPRSLPIYGRATAAQKVHAGAFIDRAVATLAF